MYIYIYVYVLKRSQGIVITESLLAYACEIFILSQLYIAFKGMKVLNFHYVTVGFASHDMHFTDIICIFFVVLFNVCVCFSILSRTWNLNSLKWQPG